MSKETFSNRELLIYLTVMLSFGTIVAIISYIILGWFGVDGNSRVFAAGQIPVIILLMFWILALIFGKRSK